MEQFNVKVQINQNQITDAFVYVLTEINGLYFSLSTYSQSEFEKSIKEKDGENYFYKFNNFSEFYDFTLKSGLIILDFENHFN